jgi:N-acetylmuramoyl-L-alanine amidase
MSLRRNKNQGAALGGIGGTKNQSLSKRVADIILSPDHQAYNSPDDIGLIFFTDVKNDEEFIDPTSLPSAKPINRNSFTYPNIGEIVQITESTGNDIYSDLEGNLNNKVLYYSPAVNIHNNTTSNALPTEKRTKKRSPKKESNVQAFSFKKEFRSVDREIARSQLNDYLRGLGYTSGTSDTRAPKYRLFQNAEGTYIFRLDDSEDNNQVAIKLGTYFQENPELRPLRPTEGDSIQEGKSGQRIRMTTTGPNGINAVSNNVTDTPDDGNPSVGDPAMILSLGSGENENVTKDAASIYMLSNQSINIDATSTNVDSLNSTYEPLKQPLEELSASPSVIVPRALPEAELNTQPIQFNFDGPQVETSTLQEPAPITSSGDPVFDALDESVREELLKYEEELIEISGTEFAIPEAENQPFVIIGEENLNPDEIPSETDYKQINIDAQYRWEDGGEPVFKNKNGGLLKLPQPDPDLEMNNRNLVNRNIKYLCIHTTATDTTSTPASLMRYFLNEKDRIGWNVGGYHWIIGRDGNATRCYPDSIITNGALGINQNSIHLSWIGHRENYDATQLQITRLGQLIKKYVETYPNIQILGHNQISNKACPGFNVPRFVSRLKSKYEYRNIKFYNIWGHENRDLSTRQPLGITGNDFFPGWNSDLFIDISNKMLI